MFFFFKPLLEFPSFLIPPHQKVTKLLVRRGLGREIVSEASAGDIVGVAGLSKASVTDTVRAIPEGLEKDKSLKADWAIPFESGKGEEGEGIGRAEGDREGIVC